MRRFFEQLIAGLAAPPPPGPSPMPQRWRMPFYVGLIVVSAVLLVLVVWYVVMPGIRAQDAGRSNVPAGAEK